MKDIVCKLCNDSAETVGYLCFACMENRIIKLEKHMPYLIPDEKGRLKKREDNQHGESQLKLKKNPVVELEACEYYLAVIRSLLHVDRNDEITSKIRELQGNADAND